MQRLHGCWYSCCLLHPRSELERLVLDAESQRELQRSLRHCRSRKELILAARRLGYRITRMDLQREWLEDQAEAEGQKQAGG